LFITAILTVFATLLADLLYRVWIRASATPGGTPPMTSTAYVASLAAEAMTTPGASRAILLRRFSRHRLAMLALHSRRRF
jgi:hypothetical protein